MKVSKSISIALITLLVGFMLAIQFETAKKPKTRDTRDIWQLQEDLAKEQKTHEKLISELNSTESLLTDYKGKQDDSKIKAMNDALSDLKKKAGLTQVQGQGVEITVKPLVDDSLVGQTYNDVSPSLLRRLINELNEFGAKEISIAGERIINTTPIRLVNNETLINDHRLPGVPYKIDVLADNPDDLNKRIQVSQSSDEFAREGLQLDSVVKKSITIPAYTQPILVHYMKPVKEGN